MRIAKTAAIVLGSLIALLLVLALGVHLFVNPNDYKGRIEARVKSATGRDLALPGDIKLSVFPWIALELGPASLGNPPGFGSQPFASVHHVALRVKLLPLLHKELEIGRVKIDGLDLRLLKNAQGQGNWQGFSGQGSTAETPSGASAGASGTPSSFPDLAGLSLTNSRLSNGDVTAEHLDLEIGHLAAGATVPVKLRLELRSGSAGPSIPVAANLQMRAAPGMQTFEVPTFTLELAGARLSGSLHANHPLDSPQIMGAFKLEAVALRRWMTALGYPPPATRDPKALESLAASGQFTYGGDALRATGLEVRLDQSTLQGTAGITSIASKAIGFDLALDRIDLDRYRSPAHPTNATAPPTHPEDEPAAADPLKTLRLAGTFAIGSAHIAGLALTQIRIGIDSHGGLTKVAPARAKLYGGDYSGEVTLDERSATPAIALDQSMTGVDVAALLEDFAHTKRLSGHGNVTTRLTAQGRTRAAVLRSLAGHVETHLAGGAVAGLDLWFEINRAVALFQKQTLPSGASAGRTQFDVFKASADVASGIATTHDLNIVSQQLRITGQGTANLVTEAIDYQIKATILKGTAGGAGAAGASAGAGSLVDIPVAVTGTLASPKVRPDLEGMFKSRLQQEFNKGQLEQQLGQKLKGLLK